MLRDTFRSDKHNETFGSLGMKSKFLEPHSIHKGDITHTASGVILSPPISSICIHATWKIPGVISRYLQYENAGDQYVGRSLLRSVCSEICVGSQVIAE